MDDGAINAENSRDVNYGCTGKWVIKLVSELIGVGHTIFCDNLFASVPLACFLAANFHQYMIYKFFKTIFIYKYCFKALIYTY